MHEARLASKANLDAIVCSAHEVSYVKKIFKREIITPGIRLIGDKVNDQKQAIKIRNHLVAENFMEGQELLRESFMK